MSYLNRNQLKNFFVNLKKYFKSEEFLNTMAISNAEIDSIANTAGYNDNGTGTVNYDFVPRSGGGVMTGSTLGRTVNNDELRLDGGTTWNDGVSLSLSGKNRTNNEGKFLLHTTDGTDTSDLTLLPDGTFTHNNNDTIKNIAMQEDTVPRSGGAVMTGAELYRTIDSDSITVGGGSAEAKGGSILCVGKDRTFNAGAISLRPHDGSEVRNMLLKPNGTWTWDGSAVQITSDQRYKQQINAIDDKLLDAWKDVAPVQFKYNDSVNEKGDKARLHTGYVVQQIDEACQKHDVDINNYGLYCHEVYENDEHYSLRYTEALIVECAFLRREVERLTERVTNLESRRKRTTS